MEKKKRRPVRGGAVGKPKKTYAGQVTSTTRPLPSNPPTTHPLSATGAADSVDLPAFRARLVGARRRLVERIADDFPADRRFPDSGWTRMLADIQAAIMAVDAIVAEASP